MLKNDQKKTLIIFTFSASILAVIGLVYGRSNSPFSLTAQDTAKSIVYNAETNCPESGEYPGIVDYDAGTITNKGEYDVVTRVAAVYDVDTVIPIHLGDDHFALTQHVVDPARIVMAVGVNNPTSFSIDFDGYNIENLRASLTLVDTVLGRRVDGFEIFSNTSYDLTSYSGVRYLAITVGTEDIQSADYSIFIDAISITWVC